MQDNMNRKLGGGGVYQGKIFEKNVSTQGRTQEHFFRIQMICLENFGPHLTYRVVMACVGEEAVPRRNKKD